MTELCTVDRLYQGDTVARLMELAENPNEKLAQRLDALTALGMWPPSLRIRDFLMRFKNNPEWEAPLREVATAALVRSFE
jgi:hypothetical protein